MGHIRHVSGRASLLALIVRGRGSAAAEAGGGSMILLNWGWRAGIGALAVLLALEASAQPRGTPTRAQQGPALPPTGHQTEPVDLNEGKSPAELFQAGCSVCHQSPAGLAKGRREGELTGFLRQHYSSSVQHAGTLASFLVSRGAGPAAAVPARQTPVERPPAPVGRRPADEERKPQEVARPDREPASKRKPPAAAARTPQPAAQQAPAAATAAAAAAAVPVPGPEAAPAPAPEPTTSASSPPAEEKPAAPEIPL